MMDTNKARCILLASVMEADKLYCIEEIEHGLRVANQFAQTDRNADISDWTWGMENTKSVETALETLRKLSPDEKDTLIGDLWMMASCDSELHTAEAFMIGKFTQSLLN